MQVKTLIRKANKLGGQIKIDSNFFWTLPPKYKNRKALSYTEFKEVVEYSFTLEEDKPNFIIVDKDKVVIFEGEEDIQE